MGISGQFFIEFYQFYQIDIIITETSCIMEDIKDKIL